MTAKSMNLRRRFIKQAGAGFLSSFLIPLPAFTKAIPGFDGLVVSEEEGETLLLRNGTTVLKIKVAKTQGSENICFLSESILPNEGIPVHKHGNEDELIFIHKGEGLFTLGEKQYSVREGAVAVVPKGVWHGLQNTGNENIEMRFAYTPSGFEGFFREVGTSFGQPFVKKTAEEKRIIAKKWGIVYKV